MGPVSSLNGFVYWTFLILILCILDIYFSRFYIRNFVSLRVLWRWNIFFVSAKIAFIIFLVIKPTRCTNFSNLFLEWNSTCFEQFRCTTRDPRNDCCGLQGHCIHWSERPEISDTGRLRHVCWPRYKNLYSWKIYKGRWNCPGRDG